MNNLRPLAGALLATLMFVPPPLALADEVLPLDPGGGLPPIEETGPAATEPVPTTVAESSGSDSSSDSDYTDEPVLQTRHFGLQVSLTCQVADANVLVVINQSAEALPPGTRIKWQIKSEGKVGFFALLGSLDGGEKLVADNVLQSPADLNAQCIARVI